MRAFNFTGAVKPQLTKELGAKIKDFALNSPDRLSAKIIDCYAFVLTGDGGWEGGWDCSYSLMARDADYILMLDSGKIVKVESI